MTTLAEREKRREYQRAYRAKNPGKRKVESARRYASHRQKIIDGALEWAARNPERIKAYRKRQYAENAEENKARSKEWRRLNPEKARDVPRQWRLENRERANAAKRAYWAKRPELRKAIRKRYRATKPEAQRLYAQNRRAQKKGGGRLTRGLIKALLVQQSGACPICRRDFAVTGYHVDHIVPLARGGLHCDSNIQLLCPSCNQHKSDKMPDEYLNQIKAARR